MVGADAVTQAQNLGFARHQFIERTLDFFFHRHAKELALRIVRFVTLHKVQTACILVVADRSIDRFHASHGLRKQLHLGKRHAGQFRKLGIGRVAAAFL